MIQLLECSASVVFVAGNLMVWSCVLIAGWAESRLDEFRLATEPDIFRRQFFEFEES